MLKTRHAFHYRKIVRDVFTLYATENIQDPNGILLKIYTFL